MSKMVINATPKKEEIVRKWLAEAYQKARKKGLKRMLNIDKLVEMWMDEEAAFMGLPEEKNLMIKKMEKFMLDIEKICQLADKGEVQELSLKKISDICLW